MRQLSKSKLMAYRQCPKRLWLELHQPELRDDSASAAAFAAGNLVGEVAREVFDPRGDGINVDPNEIGWDASAAQTEKLLASGNQAIFEAYLQIPGALALADVMRPDPDFKELRWEMIEVKGAASLKDYYRDDLAIQTYLADQAGIPLSKSYLAHINSRFVYQGGGNYAGLFNLVDLTEESRSRAAEVANWLEEAQAFAAMKDAPEIEVGPQCTTPFTCGFCAHCHKDEPAPLDDPFKMLSRLSAKKKERWAVQGIGCLEAVPDDDLSANQTLIKSVHLSGEPFFDSQGARARIEEFGGTPYFLDFETAKFAVPTWTGTRPYQDVPFQYSLHRFDRAGNLHHREFLELDGTDPRERLCRRLIEDCDSEGPIYVYNASFEKRIIRDLLANFPEFAGALETILARIVDLWPIARDCYYHPSQNGSWSLKAVAPAIAPELSYSELAGVQCGTEAAPAYFEACAPQTTPERKDELRQQMLEYCKLDTLATVRIWEYFKGKAF